MRFRTWCVYFWGWCACGWCDRVAVAGARQSSEAMRHALSTTHLPCLRASTSHGTGGRLRIRSSAAYKDLHRRGTNWREQQILVPTLRGGEVLFLDVNGVVLTQARSGCCPGAQLGSGFQPCGGGGCWSTGCRRQSIIASRGCSRHLHFTIRLPTSVQTVIPWIQLYYALI